MRVDGTLMGMDEESKKMIPQWRRGHFSMLFDASTQPATVLICDHEKKVYADMAKKKKARDLDAEVPPLVHSVHRLRITRVHSTRFFTVCGNVFLFSCACAAV